MIEKDSQIEGYGHMKVYVKDGITKVHIFGLYLTPAAVGKQLGKSIVEQTFKEASCFPMKLEF